MKKIFFIFIFMIVLSTQLSAYTLDVYFPKNVILVDKKVTKELSIHNLSDKTELITLTAFTSPFSSSFSEEQFSLAPNQTKKIEVVFSPLLNYLDTVYTSSIEIKSKNYYIKETFTITQKSNKNCQIDIDHSIKYVPSSDNFRFDLFLTNNSNEEKEIEIIGLKDINFSDDIGVIKVPKKEKISNVRIFKTENTSVFLEYRCNGLYYKKEIQLPEKKEAIDFSSQLSGFLIFFNSYDFFNSLIFQIILVIILIILVLSFSTKYLRYVYRR